MCAHYPKGAPTPDRITKGVQLHLLKRGWPIFFCKENEREGKKKNAGEVGKQK